MHNAHCVLFLSCFQLPIYFIVSLGCYGLLMVGVGLMQFPTCPQEAILLQQVFIIIFFSLRTRYFFNYNHVNFCSSDVPSSNCSLMHDHMCAFQISLSLQIGANKKVGEFWCNYQVWTEIRVFGKEQVLHIYLKIKRRA